MEENSKKKNLIIIGVITLLIVILVVIFILIFGKEESYRVVKIYELDGTATVTREETGEIEIYPNMVLASGDEVYLKEGLMTLKLDEDKYVYVEEDTRFSLVATGKASDSKTSIQLKQGAIINEIRSPLAEDASYEVHTQNSSMSVRGTTFRVAVYYDENGTLYTKVSVFEGKVETQLVFKDGTKADPRMIEFGKETIIFEDDTNTDYLEGIRDIKYDELSVSALETLLKLVKSGLNLSVTEEYLNEVLAALKGETPQEEDVTTEEEAQEPEEPDKAEEEEPVETDDDVKETPPSAPSNAPTNPTNPTTPSNPPADDTDDTDDTEDGPYTVTFKYNGTTFATQSVKAGACATKPTLMPASTGSWDFDFSTVITKNTTINWK